MFRKWFIRCMSAVVLVIAVLSVTLAYQFTQNNAGVSTPVRKEIAELNSVVAVKGQSIDPYDFLESATSPEVVAFFSDGIDTNSPGVHEVSLTLNDGTNRAEATATMYVLDTADSVTMEVGADAKIPDERDFVANADILPPGETFEVEVLSDLAEMKTYEVGNYNVDLLINNVEIDSTLCIVDTTAPSAAPVGLTVNLGEEVAPQDFVQDVDDMSEVTVAYLNGNAPDTSLPGDHLVTVVLEDAGGNKANVNSMLKVLRNTEPPYFEGLNNFEAFIGDPVMYRMGVTAFDSFGNPLEFEVDSEAVDISLPGDYPVKYSVTDASGNSIEKEIIVTVVNISEEVVMEMLDPVMESIITDEMTQLEKASAIFNWIVSNIAYVSDAPKNSAYEGAYRALRQGNGDCFTFYAIAEVMLNRAGIPNERVTRIEEASSRHYWNLVNADGNGWYHFDSTPVLVHSLNRFMFTDGDAASYTETIRVQTGARDYYSYDKSLHPEVVQ